ncbi:hypothetical protein DAI43_15295 [Achromobacter xylosoxidans]|nr:hypothetical protein DAI43_15295 [Achromobacter xylosoxidans]
MADITMVRMPLSTKAAKIQEARVAWLSPPFTPALRMIATGADAENRKATKALVSSVAGNEDEAAGIVSEGAMDLSH